jgi:hypothetical protein
LKHPVRPRLNTPLQLLTYPNIALCRTPARPSPVCPIYYIINNYNVRQEMWVSLVWEMSMLFLWERVLTKIAYIVPFPWRKGLEFVNVSGSPIIITIAIIIIIMLLLLLLLLD